MDVSTHRSMYERIPACIRVGITARTHIIQENEHRVIPS